MSDTFLPSGPIINDGNQFVDGEGESIPIPNTALPDSGVTPGSYTNANVTFNSKGIATAAANGSGSGINLNAAGVVTSEATNSTSYADLATGGPSVTLVLTGTIAIIWISAQIQRNGTGNTGLISVAVSGATTVAASDSNSASGVSAINNTSINISAVIKLTGLTPGSNTFTMKYRVDGNSYNFFNRSIAVFAP